MAAFQYIALNDKGREEKGTLEADSSRQARQILRDKGLSPLTVDVTREEKASNNFLTNLLKPSLSVRELALVTRQLATLIAAPFTVFGISWSFKSRKSLQSVCLITSMAASPSRK